MLGSKLALLGLVLELRNKINKLARFFTHAVKNSGGSGDILIKEVSH